MEIQLSEAQVTEAVTSAIVNSVLGEKLKAQIETEVTKALQGGYQQDSVVAAVVKSVIRDSVDRVLAERRDEIKAKVSEAITDEMIGEMTRKLWDSALKSSRGY